MAGGPRHRRPGDPLDRAVRDVRLRGPAEAASQGNDDVVAESSDSLKPTVEADVCEAHHDEIAGPVENESDKGLHELNGTVAGRSAGEGRQKEERQHGQGPDDDLAQQADDGQKDDVEDGADASHDAINVVVLDLTFAPALVGVEAAMAAGGRTGGSVAPAVGAGDRAHGLVPYSGGRMIVARLGRLRQVAHGAAGRARGGAADLPRHRTPLRTWQARPFIADECTGRGGAASQRLVGSRGCGGPLRHRAGE